MKVLKKIFLPSGEEVTIPTVKPDQKTNLNDLEYLNFNDFQGLAINGIPKVFGTKALMGHSAACSYMTIYDSADDSFLQIEMPGGNRIYGNLGAKSEVTPSGKVLVGTGTAGHEMWIVDIANGTVQTIAMPQGATPTAVAWGYNFCISPFLAGTTRCFVGHGTNGLGANLPRAEVDVETGVVTEIACPNTVNYIIGSLNMIMNGDKLLLPTGTAGISFMYKFSTKTITQLPNSTPAVIIAPSFTHSELVGNKMLMGSTTSSAALPIFNWDTETWSSVTMPANLIWGSNIKLISPAVNGVVFVDNSVADTVAAFVDITNGTVTSVSPASAIYGSNFSFSEPVGNRCLVSRNANAQTVAILDFGTKTVVESANTGINTVYGNAHAFGRPRNGRILVATNNANGNLLELDVATGTIYKITITIGTVTFGLSNSFIYLTPDLILALAAGPVQMLIDYRDNPTSNTPEIKYLSRYVINAAPSAQANIQGYGEAFNIGPISGGNNGGGYNRARVGSKQLLFCATLMALAWLVDVNKL
ncbi:hypothetical protein FACS1894147_02400 [Spirochaetia bacterium]|nr:hypothetical protein FACS1894147_02400 [Spirochaetia bacterium]